jgi:hypothetical protein
MAALRHPHIVEFMAVCTMPPCVVTEYCSLGSLSDVLRAARSNPAKAAQLRWPRRLGMVRAVLLASLRKSPQPGLGWLVSWSQHGQGLMPAWHGT